MTFEVVATIKNLQGMLADLDTLTDSTEYPTGSTFHAVDTGDEFIRYIDGWVLDMRRAAAIKRSLML